MSKDKHRVILDYLALACGDDVILDEARAAGVTFDSLCPNTEWGGKLVIISAPTQSQGFFAQLMKGEL